MRFTNRGDVPVQILRWRTAWDPLVEVFTVRDHQGLVPFTGYRAFGEELIDAAFFTLQTGASEASRYDLSAMYPVDHETEARIELLDPTILVRIDGQDLQLAHECGYGDALLAPIDPGYGTATQELSIHEDCTVEQRAKLTTAFTIVHDAVRIARDSALRSDGLYRTYFGTWSPDNASTVWGQYMQMLAFDWDDQVRCFSSTCSKEDRGGYFDRLWDRIYICDFSHDSLSVRGDSLIGTLIHELSHDGGTEDVNDPGCGDDGRCYGYPDVTLLARSQSCVAGSSDCKALRNADNYELFAVDVYFNQLMVAID